MNINAIFAHLCVAVRKYFSASGGNVATIFAIAAIPLVGSVGVAIDYIHANSVRTAMQSALDSTALALVKTASSATTSQLTTSAANYFNATFNRSEVKNVQVSANYDKSSGIVTVSGSAVMPTSITGLIGKSSINLSGLSKATMAGRIWPVCVLITASTQVHTLFTSGNNANINFDNCMVQVNTTNWDAVEARNTSYIHSTNGENCFVGDIHYGDVLPPKDPSCKFFADPFVGYAMPASAATCSYTKLNVKGSATLQPGTYCGSTKVNGSDITLAPGLYIIKDGDFTISGNSNVTANGVTFVLTGNGPNFYVTGNAQLTLTPMTSGEFAGFALYLDSNANADACGKVTNGDKLTSGKTSADCVNAVDSNAIATISGIVYLANSAFLADNSAVVNVTGSFVSWALVANNSAKISIKGQVPNSTSVVAAMQKISENGSGTLRLVQ